MAGMTKEELMKHVYVRCAECEEYITDQIIRLEGKPYHGHCFFCQSCQKELNGESFVPPSEDQPEVFCVECHQQRFSQRCTKCGKAILPEKGESESKMLVFLDKNYHICCFKCQDCSCSLRASDGEGEGCFPFQGALLCRTCNQLRVEEYTRP
ncbi:thyroid receptor-interacting protein 6-like [Sycon ciliatum]|uniref:thyroid receptor-interacting protein 6-like n=1 Tax=Sycon ciliatum TaxID=27933 RepID=UPI0031F5F33B|eukprot:scpid52775/ scgid10104/ Thyroid receptor-interacting protein 6